jgi:hypothetical protein
MYCRYCRALVPFRMYPFSAAVPLFASAVFPCVEEKPPKPIIRCINSSGVRSSSLGWLSPLQLPFLRSSFLRSSLRSLSLRSLSLRSLSLRSLSLRSLSLRSSYPLRSSFLRSSFLRPSFLLPPSRLAPSLRSLRSRERERERERERSLLFTLGPLS